jgi:hypothetical protein
MRLPNLALIPASLVAATVLVACSTGDTGGPLGPDPGATVSVHAAVGTGPRFYEGALPEIRLVAADGTVLRPRKDHAGTADFPGVSTGHYRLRASLRPCDGNCGYLDPPVLTCSAPIRVDRDATFRVTWTRTRPCRVVPA